MPVTNWNVATINGAQWLIVDLAQLRIPLDWDPSSNFFLAVAAPTGGTANLPFLLKGDPGDAATLDTVVNFTPLEYNDPTPDSASMTLIGTNQWRLQVALHKGPPGNPGTAAPPSDYGTPLAGQTLIVSSDLTTFNLAAPKVGDKFGPATILSAPSGNALYTLCPVAIPAQTFDWRPDIEGQAVVTGTGPDVVVDLIARLAKATGDTASNGNIVGRAFGVPLNAPTTQVLSSGPPAGSSDAYDRVPAGQAATVYLRAERQSGADYFTTDASRTQFEVKVRPVP